MSEVVNNERRSEERTAITATLFYSSPFEAYKDTKFWSITLNSSPSGISIYTNQLIEDEFTFKVHCKALWDNPRDAKIKWCNKIDENLYRLGLSFVNEIIPPEKA